MRISEIRCRFHVSTSNLTFLPSNSGFLNISLDIITNHTSFPIYIQTKSPTTGSLELFHALLWSVQILWGSWDTHIHGSIHSQVRRIASPYCGNNIPCRICSQLFLRFWGCWLSFVPPIFSGHCIIEGLSHLQSGQRPLELLCRIPQPFFVQIGWWLGVPDFVSHLRVVQAFFCQDPVKGCSVHLLSFFKDSAFRV